MTRGLNGLPLLPRAPGRGFTSACVDGDARNGCLDIKEEVAAVWIVSLAYARAKSKTLG